MRTVIEVLAAATLALLAPSQSNAAIFTSACIDNDHSIALCYVDNMPDLNLKIEYIINKLLKIFPSKIEDLEKFKTNINQASDVPPGNCVLLEDIPNTYFCEIKHIYSLDRRGYIIWSINARFSHDGAAIKFTAFPRNAFRLF